MKLDRHDSEILKGWAIVFMVIHHVLGFPERFPPGLEPSELIPGLGLGLALGLFGKICVASFLFLSGYGMGAKPSSSLTGTMLHRMLNFYGIYLANFILVVAALWLLLPHFQPEGVPWRPPVDLGIPSLLKNASLLTVSLNQEWWFAKLYLFTLVLIYPAFEMLARHGKAWLIGPLSALLWILGERYPILSWTLSYQTIFALGFLLARQPSLLASLQPVTQVLGTRLRQFIAGLLLFILCLVVRNQMPVSPFVTADLLLAPLWLYACLLLTRALRGGAAFGFLGEHSSNIWLTHTVFCYYLFRKAYYSLHHPLLIVAAVLASSLLLSLLTMPLVKRLSAGLSSLGGRIRP